MLTNARSAVLLAVMIAIVAGAAHASRRPSRRPNWPMRCAGISVAGSSDGEVRRRQGRGLFRSDEGHIGGRYFVDPRHRVTLHVTIGDGIESITYSRGVRLPVPNRGRGSVPKEAISAQLTPFEQTEGGIRLGARVSTVLGRFGKPTKDIRDRFVRVLRYDDDGTRMSVVAFYEAEFRFEHDRLVSVMLYNGC